MLGLATTASEHTTICTTLAELTAAAVQLIDGIDCANVLLIKDGEFYRVGSTSAIATAVDQAQERLGEGPCIDAAEQDVVIRCDDLRTDGRWPNFARAARDAGVLRVMSYRLYTQGPNSGALNLFGFTPGSLTPEFEAVGAMLATHAALAIIAADRQQQFESALATRDLIGQAKGIIMERFDVDAIRAFQLLTRLSQESNTPVRVVAERLTRREKKSTV
jgi:GAF domain-containing protein